MIGIESQPEIEKKIKTLEEVVPIVEKLKAEGKVVVTNNGSYDVIHIGHVISLFEAKKAGDVLVVAINSDKSVKAYKGPKRPLNSEDMRMRMLAALSCVDFVFTFDETVPMPYLEKLKPNVHTNGAEYTEDCIERETVERNGGKIHLLPMVEGIKSTMLIEKIVDAYGKNN
jgi:D-glycero-beta-D-manno-heptose 1-phosphate adenylyltransferase